MQLRFIAMIWFLAVALGGCGQAHLGSDGAGTGGGGAGGGGQAGAGAGGAGAADVVPASSGQAGMRVGVTDLMGSHPTGSGQADAGPADAGPADAGPACASQRAVDRADPYQNDASTDLLLVLAERVTALRFTTVAAYPTQDPNVNLTVTDPSAARDACRMTVTLPVMPPGTYHCPPDRGVRYVMECFDTNPAGDACPIIVATINPGWCQTATITDGTTTLARWTATAPGYWDRLAADLGVPVSALFR